MGRFTQAQACNLVREPLNLSGSERVSFLMRRPTPDQANVSILKAGCVAFAVFVLALPAHGQTAPANDTVRVNISDHQMVNRLARALKVDVGQIPLVVQVPIRVAARVCGMRPRELAADDSGEPANCDAMRVSAAFRRAVRGQLLEQ